MTAKAPIDLCGKKVGTTRSTSFPVEIEKWSKQNCEATGKPAIQYVPGENTSTSATSSSRAASTPRCRAARRCLTRRGRRPANTALSANRSANGYQGIMFRKDDAALREVVTETSHRDDRRRLLQGHSRQMGTGRQRGRPAHDECVHAMKSGTGARGGFSRSFGDDGSRVRPHWLRWLSAALILVVLACDRSRLRQRSDRMVLCQPLPDREGDPRRHHQHHGDGGARDGARHRLGRRRRDHEALVQSGSDVRRRRLHLVVPRHAADPATAAVVQPRAGVSDHRHSGPVVGAGGRRHDAVPVRAARARHQSGRLYVRGDAGGHAVGRCRAI